MPTNVLHVTMFGGLTMALDDRPLAIRTNSTSKVMQILQYLIHAYPAPVPTETFVRKLFSGSNVVNPRNNLKVSISQLRKLLASWGLPGDRFIGVNTAGYFWDSALPLQVDVHDFMEAMKTARMESSPTRKAECLHHAVSLYQGNFLPALDQADWARSYSIYYANQFAKAVQYLVALHKQRQQWANALQLAERAYRLLRTDEWQVLRIECLMRMGRWEEAKAAYNEAVSMLARDYSLPPTEALTTAYTQISQHNVRSSLGSFGEILTCLQEPEGQQGAYQCTFLGFIDLYRVTLRSRPRKKVPPCLILCTLGGRDRSLVQNDEQLFLAVERVARAIMGSLRSTDFFAQYSKNQFILCLPDTQPEDCGSISESISLRYRQDPARGIHLFFDVKPAASPLPDSRPFDKEMAHFQRSREV